MNKCCGLTGKDCTKAFVIIGFAEKSYRRKKKVRGARTRVRQRGCWCDRKEMLGYGCTGPLVQHMLHNAKEVFFQERFFQKTIAGFNQLVLFFGRKGSG